MPLIILSMSQIMMASICLHTCWRFIRSRIAYFTCSPEAVKNVLKIGISNIRTYDRIRKEKGSFVKIQLNLNNTTASLVWVYLAMFGGEFLGSWPVFQRVPGVQENCDQLHPVLDNDLELSSFGHEYVLLSLRHALTYGFKWFKLSSSTGIFRMLVP